MGGNVADAHTDPREGMQFAQPTPDQSNPKCRKGRGQAREAEQEQERKEGRGRRAERQKGTESGKRVLKAREEPL